MEDCSGEAALSADLEVPERSARIRTAPGTCPNTERRAGVKGQVSVDPRAPRLQEEVPVISH